MMFGIFLVSSPSLAVKWGQIIAAGKPGESHGNLSKKKVSEKLSRIARGNNANSYVFQ
jgi:hypothetical protein